MPSCQHSATLLAQYGILCFARTLFVTRTVSVHYLVNNQSVFVYLILMAGVYCLMGRQKMGVSLPILSFTSHFVVLLPFQKRVAKLKFIICRLSVQLNEQKSQPKFECFVKNGIADVMTPNLQLLQIKSTAKHLEL